MALKLRFELGEEGDHIIEIKFCDPDMHNILDPLEVETNIQTENDLSMVFMQIWNIHGFELENDGEFIFELRVDGTLQSRIPLYVIQSSEGQ